MGHAWALLLVLLIVLLQSGSQEPLPPAPAVVRAVPAAPAQDGKPRSARPPLAGSELLAARRLAVPVQGVRRTQLRDTFEERRGAGRKHKAIDIMAPWGTPVLAVDDGRIAKISSNRGGGLALYQADPTGRFVYYYAHLAGYADDLREGQAVRRGDVIAYVGATGNAPATAPHLHFAVMLLAPERRWWGGEAVNPYGALTRDGPVAASRP
jgi:peptidoglycan LD-endopeptidase LytH